MFEWIKKKRAGYQDEIIRAGKAARLLEDPMLTGAFDLIRTNLENEWKGQGQYDAEKAESCWRTLKCLNALEEHLRGIIEDGQVATQELARLSDQEET